jgi:hypothetical protein
MGAISIEIRSYGKNIKEAFVRAQKEAEEEHGQDIYNGAINNCSLVKDVSSKRPVMHPDELHEYILDHTGKRDVMGYCEAPPKLNENKIKTQVENFPQEGTRQWKTLYQAVVDWSGEVVCKASTQTECIKKARVYVEKHNDVSLKVMISKQLEEGNKACAKVTYKKASGERDGQYMFVGYAPC